VELPAGHQLPEAAEKRLPELVDDDLDLAF
jgi:hypothetical protein